MKRTQTVSFTETETEVLNEGLDILHRHGAKVTPKAFIKKEAIARAKSILGKNK